MQEQNEYDLTRIIWNWNNGNLLIENIIENNILLWYDYFASLDLCLRHGGHWVVQIVVQLDT